MGLESSLRESPNILENAMPTKPMVDQFEKVKAVKNRNDCFAWDEIPIRK